MSWIKRFTPAMKNTLYADIIDKKLIMSGLKFSCTTAMDESYSRCSGTSDNLFSITGNKCLLTTGKPLTVDQDFGGRSLTPGSPTISDFYKIPSYLMRAKSHLSRNPELLFIKSTYELTSLNTDFFKRYGRDPCWILHPLLPFYTAGLDGMYYAPYTFFNYNPNKNEKELICIQKMPSFKLKINTLVTCKKSFYLGVDKNKTKLKIHFIESKNNEHFATLCDSKNKKYLIRLKHLKKWKKE